VHDSLLAKLDNEKKILCEGPITAEECLATLKTFQHSKTPGTDGLSPEFYLYFWNDISGPLINSLNYSAFVGELSISQRQGIISLMPKKKTKTLYCLKIGALSLF